MLNLSLLKENYDSKFIETVANVYDSQKKFPNKDYFTKPGYYNQDLKFKDTEGETIDYFRAILYPPNLAILDYVLSNFDYFRDKVFLDYAAGFGLLSVFLKHIGIQCYNYDNFSQITNTEPFRKEILNSTGLSIEPVLDAFPDQKIDVLTCSGFWLRDRKSVV